MGAVRDNEGLQREAPVRSFNILAKPVGPSCNLGCRYCFYSEKEAVLPAAGRFLMAGDVLEAFVKKYIAAQDGPEVQFVWQGGEPLLAGLDFYSKAVRLQHKYAAGKKIVNAMQTNGTLLDDDWCRFLKEHDFLVGLSIDGPEDVHDRYRVGPDGAGTFGRAMEGMGRLREHGVPFNVLASVTGASSKKPSEVYNFFKNHGVTHIQFAPVVERLPDASERTMGLRHATPVTDWSAKEAKEVTDYTVRPLDYGDFLIGVFNEWIDGDVGSVFVMNFEWALASWLKLPASYCIFGRTCGDALAIERNGDIYSCDHFVYPQYRLGNIVRDSPRELLELPAQKRFGQNKADKLPRYCRECDVLFACNGECPKNRFALTPDGEPGLNYLCAGYKKYFHHIHSDMTVMALLVENGRPAADVMKWRRMHAGRLETADARVMAGPAGAQQGAAPS
ncbi:MAG: anaerobic sulfatase maturase [Thermoleophilia bacterium]|nr:anaerobic sulfatase maturase [Thermoleophilia bacterium]